MDRWNSGSGSMAKTRAPRDAATREKQAFRSPAIEDDIARGEDVILLEIAVPIAAVEDFDENFLQGSKGEDFRPKQRRGQAAQAHFKENPQRLPSVR